MAIWFIYWVLAAFWTKRTAVRHGWWNGWWAGLIMAGLILLRRGAPTFSGGAILWRDTPVLDITADLVTLIGLIVTLWARTTLGGNWSSSVVIKEDHELIERGPYRYVSHPIYSGTILMVLGMVIWWGRAAGLMLLVVCNQTCNRRSWKLRSTHHS